MTACPLTHFSIEMFASQLAYNSVFSGTIQSSQLKDFCEATASNVIDESLDGVTTTVL